MSVRNVMTFNFIFRRIYSIVKSNIVFIKQHHLMFIKILTF
jgi:hypothetical protein